jgi:hypothetical protein
MRTTLDGGGEPVGTAALLADLDLLGHDVSTGDIVVGADYGRSGYHALRWAALIAQARRRRLRIERVVREVDWLLDPRPLEDLIAVGERLAHAVLNDYTCIARSIAPGIDIRAGLSRGSLYSLLPREAETVGLLVLGAGNDYRAATAGQRAVQPVAGWFTRHASCPVLVVDRVGREVPGHPARNEGHVAHSGEA